MKDMDSRTNSKVIVDEACQEDCTDMEITKRKEKKKKDPIIRGLH